MERTLLMFLVVFTVLVVQSRGQIQSIGKCNLTFFTGGGQKCQRDMIMELKNNNMTNCSSEYGNETACLNNHVNTCVKDDPLLNSLRGEISKLLVLLVYHCGNVNSNNVQGISQLILTTVQCNRGALNSIVNCWDDFRSAFEANKSDTSLCRKYADAKKNCVNIARQACDGICMYIPKDEYNPFCGNHMDPPGTSDLFDCIRTLGCSEKVVYEEAMKCDKLSSQDFAGSPQDCSTELRKNADCLRNNLNSKCPALNQKAQIFDDLEIYLRGILTSQRFFCSKAEVNTAMLHRSVQEIANCQPAFFTEAEKCAEPFRKTYTEVSQKKSSGVCTAFAEAKKCLNKAHKDSCSFDEETLKAATFDDENPFCEDGKDPKQKSGAGGAGALAAAVYLFSLYSFVSHLPSTTS